MFNFETNKKLEFNVLYKLYADVSKHDKADSKVRSYSDWTWC